MVEKSAAAELRVGEYTNETYGLSGGGLTTSATMVFALGTFNQSGGTHLVDGELLLTGGMTDRWWISYATYQMSNGVVRAKSANMSMARFLQTGGSCHISGLVTFSAGFGGAFQVNGGTFQSLNTRIVNTYALPYFVQNGGIQIVTNTLQLEGSGDPSTSHSFALKGGQLVVSNLVARRTAFSMEGGTVTQSGVLTLNEGTIRTGPGEQQFGRLLLDGSNGYLNSSLQLASGASVVRFLDSSATPWSSDARLMITNWAGSLAGGGAQQVVFGTGASALTTQQLSQIAFVDPAGTAPGAYAARILPSGEIVPQNAPLMLGINSVDREPNGRMSITVRGEIGRRFAMEASTNLRDWFPVTNRPNTTGTLSLTDPTPAVHPHRFYRVVLLP